VSEKQEQHGDKTSISVSGDVGGDVVGRDKIEGDKVGRDKITRTEPQSPAQANLEDALTQWKRDIEARVEALADLDSDEKEEIKVKAAKVEAEVAKGADANPKKIERLINTMSAMAPDILEVTAKTLQNPLAGVGLVLEKIGDRARLERQSQTDA